MAGVIKVNPNVAAQDWAVVGKELTHFNIGATAIPNQSGTAADQPGWEADGAVNTIYAIIQRYGTIIISGPLATGAWSVTLEGEFDATTVAAALQVDIRALGATFAGTKVDGTANTVVNLASSTVVEAKYALAAA